MHKPWYIVRITSDSQDPWIIKSFWDRATAYKELIFAGYEWNEEFHVMHYNTLMAVKRDNQLKAERLRKQEEGWLNQAFQAELQLGMERT